jgi:ankyrin repeat protein
MVNSKNSYDQIPLYVAAWSGRAGVLELLLQKEGDMNLKSKIGQVLLWLAVTSGHEATVKPAA